MSQISVSKWPANWNGDKTICGLLNREIVLTCWTQLLVSHKWNSFEYTCSPLSFNKIVNIQRDSKRCTRFRKSIFPELWMVCECSTLDLKEEVLNFQIPPLERSPSCGIWRYARCTAVAESVLMNSRKQKILCRIVAILLSTDAAARMCAR
jgi:hypothetical protein